jgi:hypothetical protein
MGKGEREWQVIRLRSRGEYLGVVVAKDDKTAVKAAVKAFNLPRKKLPDLSCGRAARYDRRPPFPAALVDRGNARLLHRAGPRRTSPHLCPLRGRDLPPNDRQAARRIAANVAMLPALLSKTAGYLPSLPALAGQGPRCLGWG